LGSLLTPCFADEPAPDPSGTATGDRTTTTDAAGNPFVVSAPPDPSAPDYAQKKKDYDDFEAQLAKEPLAGKLADNLGHVRIATNFSWTLLTGYLVLFMQAGFALLTCGLVRKKNAAHLMMLNFAAYVFAFLAYYAVGYAFQFGAVAINAAPANLGGTPTLNHFLLGSGLWGFLGGKGFFLSGPGYDAGSLCLTLFEVVFMETAGYSSWEQFSIPPSVAGFGVGAGYHSWARPGILGTATWISPARLWFTPWEGLPPWPCP